MDHASERKSLSKKRRFAVLHRDQFTCRYCGRKAPEVALEVDHLTPIAFGGTDDTTNLITSCRDCNRGKAERHEVDGTTYVRPHSGNVRLRGRNGGHVDMPRTFKVPSLLPDGRLGFVYRKFHELTSEHWHQLAGQWQREARTLDIRVEIASYLAQALEENPALWNQPDNEPDPAT